MRPDDLLEWLRKTPFEPFTMEITNGRRYSIRHPDQMWVGRSRCHLGVFDCSSLLDRTVDIALVHIVKIEPGSSANGRKKRTKR